MANLSQIKREQMIAFLEKLKAEHNDDESLIAINQIEKELTSKKYGLVWEEHSEEVEEEMRAKIPVFTEDRSKEISLTEGWYNFILEGDNLHSLKLLEKTHKGKIDVIYIDPPYNTGLNDFVYDDVMVNADDGYRHSKWLSFMSKRLRIAKKLLSNSGFIFISIDDNEIAQLKALCDEIFGESNHISTHHVQVRYVEKSLADGKQVKPVMEYVLFYAKDAFFCDINLPKEKYSEEKFIFDIKELKKGHRVKYDDGTEMEVFYPGEWIISEKQEADVSLLKETWISGTIYTKMSYGQVVRKYIEPRYNVDGTGCLYKVMGRGDDGRGYRYYVGPSRKNASRCKMYSGMPLERVEEVTSEEGSYRDVPISNSYDFAPDFGNIASEGGVAFNSGKKPIKMLKQLINYHKGDSIVVLDFFAGSGSSGHAVLSLNDEDGGRRRFILCTNNENNICEHITYKRITNCIKGYKKAKGYPSNLKYYKTNFVNKESENLYDELLDHVVEMIQLQYGIKVDNKKYVIIMDDDEMDSFEKTFDQYNELKVVFINQDVLLSTSQENLLSNVNTFTIPDCYFDFELREAGEIW